MDPDNVVWAATRAGLSRWSPDAHFWCAVDPHSLTGLLYDLAIDASGSLWFATEMGLFVVRDDGIPSADVRAIHRAPDASIWIGTEQGIAIGDGTRSTIRRGKRWLLDDAVRRITFNSIGSAWVATGAGVSRLGTSALTFEAKAEHFAAVLRSRHVRPPGIIGNCR